MKILILSILTIGIWTIPSYPKERIAQREGTAKAPKGAQNCKGQNPDECSTIKTTLDFLRQQQTQSQAANAQQTTEQTAVEGKLTTFTGWLVVVGVLQAVILGFTAWFIRKQIVVTKDTERAWIIVSPEDKPLLLKIPEVNDKPRNPKEREGNDIRFSVLNTGNTPAKLCESALHYRLVKRLEDIPEKPDYGKVTNENGLLLVKRDSKGITAMLCPEAILYESEYSAIIDGKAFLYAFGFVSYKDTYNRSRETRFGYLCHFPVQGSMQDPEFRRDGLPPAYNGAT